MMLFTRLGRYLYSQTLQGLGMVLGVVLTLILLIDFIEETRTVGTRADAGPLALAELTLLKTPMLVETTLPFIVLFGTMYAMFRLNRRSELVVMRASGLSAWRFLTPPLAIAVIIGLLAPMALNPVSSALNARFEERRTQLIHGENRARMLSQGEIWLTNATPQQQSIIRARGASADRDQLIDATFFFFEPDAEGLMTFTERIDAERARLQAGFWQLEDAVETSPGRRPRPLEAVSFPAGLDADTVFRRAEDAKSMSFWRLPDAIRAADTAGLPRANYEMRFFSLAALPAMLAAMALIGSAVSLRLVRLGGALPLALVGGAGGFLLFFTDDLLAAVSKSGSLPPPLAAAAAPLAALLLATAFIAQIEDG